MRSIKFYSYVAAHTHTWKDSIALREWNKRTKESPTLNSFHSFFFFAFPRSCPCCGWTNEKYEITKWLIQHSQFMDASWKFNYFFFPCIFCFFFWCRRLLLMIADLIVQQLCSCWCSWCMIEILDTIGYAIPCNQNRPSIFHR